MAQHFLLSKAAKSLSLAQIFRMTDAEAEATFRAVRWASTNAQPVCPHCGGLEPYEARRLNGSPRFRCKACAKDFTLTSGTLFASHKLPLRTYLGAIAIFCNEAKGKSALAISRDLGLSYKAAFVLLHKLREAITDQDKGTKVSGDVEVDGMYAGGYVKPSNYKKDRRDRRLAVNQSGKRRVVIVARERNGKTITFVCKTEDASVPMLRDRIEIGSTVYADEAAHWDSLNARYATKRINHSEAYSHDGGCTNQAESFFSRLRRAEVGTHHKIAGPYLASYAAEMDWREDNRRASTGAQYGMVASAALLHSVSRQWKGYWQRAAKA